MPCLVVFWGGGGGELVSTLNFNELIQEENSIATL